MYTWEVPVHKTSLVHVGSHAAARIGSFCIKMAASSRRFMSQIHKMVGMLSLRVQMYWLSLLHDIIPAVWLN
ncbi:hypothetical protein Hanom_Chr05g00421331 [Helianthus anomalus]